MLKLLAASTVALTLVAVSGPAHAYCDEDCAYEMHEAAQEAAYERATAHEEREEEASDRYQRDPRYDQRAGALRMQKEQETRAQRSEPKRSAQQKRAIDRRAAEPEPEPATQIHQPIAKVATENSSITSVTTRLADESGSERPAGQRDVGCKTFFPATNMTLSVPCD